MEHFRKRQKRIEFQSCNSGVETVYWMCCSRVRTQSRQHMEMTFLTEKQWSAFSNFHLLFLNSLLRTLSLMHLSKNFALFQTNAFCIISWIVSSEKDDPEHFLTVILWQSKCLKCHKKAMIKLLERIYLRLYNWLFSATANFVNGLECKNQTEIGHETAAADEKRNTKLVLTQKSLQSWIFVNRF